MLSRGHACGRKKNGLSSSINVNLSLNKCIKVLICSFESLLHLYFINRQSFSEQCVSRWNVFFPRTKLKLRREPVVEPFFRFIALFQLYKQSLYGFQKWETLQELVSLLFQSCTQHPFLNALSQKLHAFRPTSWLSQF